MKSRRFNRSRCAHVNIPEGLRNRKSKADARREAIAATLLPETEPQGIQQSLEIK